jgi:hypothetical protein
VVEVGVRDHDRVEPFYFLKGRRNDTSSVGPYASVYQNSRPSEVQKVTAATHLARSTQSLERERRPRLCANNNLCLRVPNYLLVRDIAIRGLRSPQCRERVHAAGVVTKDAGGSGR